MEAKEGGPGVARRKPLPAAAPVQDDREAEFRLRWLPRCAVDPRPLLEDDGHEEARQLHADVMGAARRVEATGLATGERLSRLEAVLGGLGLIDRANAGVAALLHDRRRWAPADDFSHRIEEGDR